MKISKFILLGLLFNLLGCSREDISIYAPIESYPADEILQNISNKTAMVIIAHDDDMCASTGTMAKLDKAGWDITVLCFSQGESRDQAHLKACSNFHAKTQFFDLPKSELRTDTFKVKYAAFVKADFDKYFNQAAVQKELISKINEVKPSVIFTLDNEIGGYGHPEHVFISQMVYDLAINGEISPEYIYQSVFTDHMEETIMARHSRQMKSWGFPGDGWEQAKSTYGVDGMPEPTVEINIQEFAKIKMNYLRSYNERERKTLGFFIPAFEEYDAEEYFSIFNREFFRVIDLSEFPD